GLEYMSLDDLYKKLKCLEIDTKGYSAIDDVIYSLIADYEEDQHLVFEDLDQVNKEAFDEYEIKHQMAMIAIKARKFEKKSQVSQESTNYKNYKKKEAEKEASESSALVIIDGSQGVNWDKKIQENITEPGVLGNYRFVAEKGTNSTVPADDVVPADAVPASAFIFTEPTIPADRVIDAEASVLAVDAHKNAVKTLEKQIKCHQKNQTAYEEKIRVLSFEVEKHTNMVSYKQKLLDQASVEKQDLMGKLENEKSINAKWLSTSKNLHKLVDSSMTARTKRGLGYVNLTGKNNWGFGDSKLSVFNSNKEDWEGKPIYNRVEAIRLFLDFASYMGFMVYQMDVKSAFLNGEIQEEVYVTQPKGFEDPKYPKRVYKVIKALYGLHQAPRAWYATLSSFLLKHGYRRGTIDQTLFLKKDSNDIILVQVYVDNIIFGSTRQDLSDEFEALMQMSPTVSNLNAVKRIFKYIKGHPKLGLWYPRDSPFDLEAFSDSDYAGADRKSTTGGCQFMGRRLISWQCKKQTIVATSSCEAEYVAAASCCGQHH
nr:putative ribonuclease H-like domain-containing protein [Tanacetum cinerariifolium]